MRTDTHCIQLYLAGDYRTAHELCRRHCHINPFCVTLSRRDFIYHAGAESGVMVEIVNYPRFPKTFVELYYHARSLGEFLGSGLCQRTFLIQTRLFTEWWTWKADGEWTPADKSEVEDETPCLSAPNARDQ